MKGAISVEDLDGGAAEEEVISDDHLRGGELEEGINAEVNYCKGILMRRMVPLEMVISTKEERGKGKTPIKTGKWMIVGTVN